MSIITSYTEQKLPSTFQIGERIYVDLGLSGSLDGFITKVHFSKTKVLYDVQVDVHMDENGTFYKTRLHNIDSTFIVKNNEENHNRLKRNL